MDDDDDSERVEAEEAERRAAGALHRNVAQGGGANDGGSGDPPPPAAGGEAGNKRDVKPVVRPSKGTQPPFPRMSSNDGKITTACVDLFIVHVLNWIGEMGRMVRNGELPLTTDTSGSQFISQALVEAKVPQGLLQTITAQVGSAACQVLKKYANLRDTVRFCE